MSVRACSFFGHVSEIRQRDSRETFELYLATFVRVGFRVQQYHERALHAQSCPGDPALQQQKLAIAPGPARKRDKDNFSRALLSES